MCPLTWIICAQQLSIINIFMQRPLHTGWPSYVKGLPIELHKGTENTERRMQDWWSSFQLPAIDYTRSLTATSYRPYVTMQLTRQEATRFLFIHSFICSASNTCSLHYSTWLKHNAKWAGHQGKLLLLLPMIKNKEIKTAIQVACTY